MVTWGRPGRGIPVALFVGRVLYHPVAGTLSMMTPSVKLTPLYQGLALRPANPLKVGGVACLGSAGLSRPQAVSACAGIGYGRSVVRRTPPY